MSDQMCVATKSWRLKPEVVRSANTRRMRRSSAAPTRRRSGDRQVDTGEGNRNARADKYVQVDSTQRVECKYASEKESPLKSPDIDRKSRTPRRKGTEATKKGIPMVCHVTRRAATDRPPDLEPTKPYLAEWIIRFIVNAGTVIGSLPCVLLGTKSRW